MSYTRSCLVFKLTLKVIECDNHWSKLKNLSSKNENGKKKKKKKKMFR